MLFVGDDWAEDHHDVEVQDETGRRLGRARVPEGVAGLARFHELIGYFGGEDLAPQQVMVGIETDRGPWVAALVAAGYRVFAVNPRQVDRYRDRHSSSGAKSDAGDAHALADMVRTDAHQLRPVAGDSPLVEGIKVTARAHQNLIWDRQRQVLRLRAALREYFPAALEAFDDLSGADALELLETAPDPVRARRLSHTKITAALRRARRHDVATKAERIRAALRGEQLAQPPELVAGYAATAQATVAIIRVFNAEITTLQGQVGEHLDRHPDAEIYRSQPGLGDVLAARVLGEFGDDPDRYANARSRKNYAGNSPITRASGKKKTVHARRVRNRRLVDPLQAQALSALSASPGANAYYRQLRDRGVGHHAALRQLSNRLVGILHGCLRSRTLYDEATAWSDHQRHQRVA
ncbi:MAG: IS110 family transposase [Pseudonocardiaceae bacterium]|nr:IS110 family transposase [Pseudonocardiaceae bacterium]